LGDSLRKGHSNEEDLEEEKSNVGQGQTKQYQIVRAQAGDNERAGDQHVCTSTGGGQAHQRGLEHSQDTGPADEATSRQYLSLLKTNLALNNRLYRSWINSWTL
jgi:hypothetical protein